MNLELAGRVAFIAGSSRGIGRAIAAALLDEGARIVLTGRNPEALASTQCELATTAEAATRILAIQADLSIPDSIENAYARTIHHFGQLDHLVANLGTGSGTTGWQPAEAEWARLFEANFFSSVRLTQAAVPHLSRSASASILFISSIVAIEATQAPLPYSAAKAALTNYAKNLSRALAPRHIRVNTICPGNVFFPGGSWERHLTSDHRAVERMLETEVPLQRFGTPAEIAALAVYLCSPLAAFTTGSTIVIDGGQTRGIDAP
jgi:3-oxoacyl-[acyl-carrier protein] reductase